MREFFYVKMSTQSALKHLSGAHGKHSGRSTTVPSFRTVYKDQCDNFYVCNRRTLLSKIPDDASLDLYVDIIRPDEWKPLLQAIRLDKSLETVTFRSTFLGNYPELIADVGRLQLVQKVQQSIHVPPLFTPDNLRAFCAALAEHLKGNPRLRRLELAGFPFSLAHLQELAGGLRASTSLTSLSLDGCSLGKPGLEVLCQTVREKGGLRELSLCGCRLGGVETEPLAWLLRQQSLGGQGALWQGVLRRGALPLDALGGLRRLSLCRNPLGDAGLLPLVEALGDNLCLRALDLQNCNLGNAGAAALLDLLANNRVLEVVDVRHNQDIEAGLVKDIAKIIESNRQGRHCAYGPLPLGKSQPLQEQPAPQHRSRSVGRLDEKAQGAQGTSMGRSSSLDRAATKRGAPLRPGPRSPSPKKHPGPKSGAPTKAIEEELLRCQESLKKEQEARQAVERQLLKLFEENRQLRFQRCKKCSQPGYTLVPESLLGDIEKIFVKFNLFLKATGMTRNYVDFLRQAPKQSENVATSATVPEQLQQAGPKEAKAARIVSTDLHNPSKAHHAKAPSKHRQPLFTSSPVTKTVTTSTPLTAASAEPFQQFVESQAEKIISEMRSASDSVAEQPSLSGISSIAPKRKGEHHTETPASARTANDDSPMEKRSSKAFSDALADLSPIESSKRLSEMLAFSKEPSKILPSPSGSPHFFTLDSDANSAKYQSDFASGTSSSSAVSEAERKGSSSMHRKGDSKSSSKGGKDLSFSRVPERPQNSKSSSKSSKSSHDSTLVSSIVEELASDDSSRSKHKPAALDSAKQITDQDRKQFPSEKRDRHDTKSLSDALSLSLSQMPSKSFDVDTADITVSSIYSTAQQGERSRRSAKSPSQRHSTPTFDNSAAQGMFEVIATPSNISLSRNLSEVSTPSTPGTMTPPQLAGSDFDGF